MIPKTDVNEDLCVVCLDNHRNTVFVPCGHLVTCNACSIEINECPICRRHIDIKQPI